MVLIKIYNLLFSDMWQSFFHYLYSMITDHLVPSFFSTIGVAIATILVMYLHYLNRKNFYKEYAPYQKQTTNLIIHRVHALKQKIDKTYQSIGVSGLEDKSLTDLSDKFNNGDIDIEQYKIFSSLYFDYLDAKIKQTFSEIDLSHLENYNFKIYLFDFLNNKYPDQHWKNKK